MKRCCLLLSLFLVLAATSASGQTKSAEPDKAENIQRLLKIMGAEKLQQNMIGQMMSALKPMMLKASNGDAQAVKIFDRMAELMTEEFKKADFAGLTVTLYDKYFTNEDVKGLIQFYESPVGQKSLEVLPTLTQESMARSMELGQSIVPKVMAQLAEEFPQLKSALKPAPGKP